MSIKRERAGERTLRCSSRSRKRFANRSADGRSHFRTLVYLTYFNGALNGPSEVEVESRVIAKRWTLEQFAVEADRIALFCPIILLMVILSFLSIIMPASYSISYDLLCIRNLNNNIWNSYCFMCTSCIIHLKNELHHHYITYIWKKLFYTFYNIIWKNYINRVNINTP